MKHGKRIVGMLLSMVLCVLLCLPQSTKAADLYFTSINDTLLPLTADSMPLWSSGVLYVPYNIFDKNTTGLNVDMNSSFNRSENIVRIYNLQKMLTFDINTGECWDDITGEVFTGRAILRNGKPYLPLRTVCERFDLTYSYTAMEHGYLVRIKNDAVVLSDARFIDAAGNLIERRLREYNQSLVPTPSTTTPSTGGTENEDDAHPNVDTYLAFACDGAAGMEKILTSLSARDDLAVFFLTPELLEEQGDLVRRLLGQGHSVGVWAKGGTVEQAREQMLQGNLALEEQAFTRTTLVLAAKELRGALEDGGLVCWGETLLLEPSDTVGPNYFAGVVSQRLNGRTRTTYLTFTSGENTARVLSAVLKQLEQEQYIVRTPLETRI